MAKRKKALLISVLVIAVIAIVITFANLLSVHTQNALELRFFR